MIPKGSPFDIDNIDEAYSAYCALPHLRRRGAKKPTKKQFRKIYNERRLERNAPEIRRAKGETTADLAHKIAELTELVTKIAGTKAETPRQRPTDAARNGVLWRLNIEGLLFAALDASEGDYITQEAGTAILTENFGPLNG